MGGNAVRTESSRIPRCDLGYLCRERVQLAVDYAVLKIYVFRAFD